jgi:hypothetical protein
MNFHHGSPRVKGLFFMWFAGIGAACTPLPPPPDADGTEVGAEEMVASASAALGGTTFASDEGHLVHLASCNGDAQCVSDVPMTGNPSPLFAEVDRAMRTFMKVHCVGSATLAVSYKGRRVYKRGFGRMHGSSMEDRTPTWPAPITPSPTRTSTSAARRSSSRDPW